MSEKDADFYFQKGYKAHIVQMYGPSKRYLKKCLELNPYHEKALYTIASLHFNLISSEESDSKDNRLKSIEYFKRYLEVSTEPAKRKSAEEIIRIIDEYYL